MKLSELKGCLKSLEMGLIDDIEIVISEMTETHKVYQNIKKLGTFIGGNIELQFNKDLFKIEKLGDKQGDYHLEFDDKEFEKSGFSKEKYYQCKICKCIGGLVQFKESNSVEIKTYCEDCYEDERENLKNPEVVYNKYLFSKNWFDKYAQINNFNKTKT